MKPIGKTVYLVSCVKKKRERPCEARDLYISTLFSKARRYVETSGCPWFILSAEYGLVAPDQVIAPYDRMLKKMGVKDQRAWAERVDTRLSETMPELSQVVFLAGETYRKFLTGLLVERGVTVSVPMQDLQIGKQLRWLGQHTAPPCSADAELGR